MPRNSDFPEYQGIRVEHVNDWDALQYHAPKSSEPKEDKATGGFQPVKGILEGSGRHPGELAQFLTELDSVLLCNTKARVAWQVKRDNFQMYKLLTQLQGRVNRY